MIKRSKNPLVEKDNIKEQKKEVFRLKSIIDDLPGDVYWKDLNGVYLGMNETGKRNLQKMGFLSRGSEIVGKTDYDLFDKRTADEFRKNDLAIIKSGTESKREEKAILPSGEEIIQLSTKRPLRDENGDIVGIAGNTVDITYLKRIESDLRTAKEKAEESNRLKMEFISNMEHDIRTPFTGAWGIANHLFEEENEPEKKELLRCIVQSLKELLDFCNTIIDFSHIETASRPLLAKKFNLRDVINSTITIEMPAAQLKKLRLNYSCDEQLPNTLIGDEYRLHRIMLNLISNAIKFTEQGEISLSAELAKKEENIVIIKIIIKDSGIGIPKDKQDIVYEAFTRVIPSNRGKYGGLGLGLRIVKRFIEEMGGEIDLMSEVGKGSTFICTLPFKLPLLGDAH